MNVKLRTLDRGLIAILLLAAMLRLGYVLAQDFDSYYASSGGDTVWYLENGYTLVTGDDPTGRHDVSRLPTGPLYLIFIGVWQALLSPAAAIAAILIAQALMGVATVYFGYDLARHLTNHPRAGLIAALVLAISPVLIIETTKVLTETLYTTLILGSLWWYVTRIATPDHDAHQPYALAGAGFLFGLAALTRAVSLLFPVGLGLHLVLIRPGWRTGLRQAAILLVVYALIVTSWTAYNLARWNRFVIVAEGFSSFIYAGSRGWESPDQLDQALSEDIDDLTVTDVEAIKESNVFLRAARRVIASDPAGYVEHRASELANAYLQPHGTVSVGGPSLKDMVQQWITEDRSGAGLRDLLSEKTFWPKVALYLFHFAGLIACAAGMWHLRRHVATAWPLIGFIVYTTLIHLVMLALPRYIFPLYPLWWVFAAAWLVNVRERWQRAPQAVQPALAATYGAGEGSGVDTAEPGPVSSTS